MKEEMNAWNASLEALEDFERSCQARIEATKEEHQALTAELDQLQNQLEKSLYQGDMDPVSALEVEIAEKRQLADRILQRIPVLENWKSHEVEQIAALALDIHNAGEVVMGHFQERHASLLEKAAALRAEYLQTVKDLGNLHRQAAEVAWRVKLTHRNHLPEGNGPRRFVLRGVKGQEFIVSELDALKALGKIPEWTGLLQRNEQPLPKNELVPPLTLAATYRADRPMTGFSPRPGAGMAPEMDEFQLVAERQATA